MDVLRKRHTHRHWLDIQLTSADQYTVHITSPNLPDCHVTAHTTIFEAPVATISSLNHPNFAIFNGASIMLTAGPDGEESYIWNTGDNSQTIPVSPITDTTYTVMVIDAHGCKDTASQRVTVNPNPVVTITSPDQVDFTICSGDSITLTATSSDGGTYSWNTIPVQISASIKVTPLSRTAYTVTVTDANGCIGNQSQTVTVNNCTATLALFDCCARHVSPTGVITYSISIKNAGGTPATGIQLQDILPSCLTYISATGPGWSPFTVVGQLVSGTLASLAPGAITTVSIIAQANCARGKTITNSITVSSDTTLPQTGTCCTKID